MYLGLLCVAPVEAPPLVYEYEGYTSAYDPGVMAATVAWRQSDACSWHCLPSTLPPVDGYIAVLHCQHIGETAVVTSYDGRVGVFLVADCAAPSAWPWMLGWHGPPYALEFDAASAASWGVGDWAAVSVN